MTAVITFAILILVIRGVPVLFNWAVGLFRARKRQRRTTLKALPPPRDTD